MQTVTLFLQSRSACRAALRCVTITILTVVKPEHNMQQYQDLIKTVLETGSWQDNRTGIRTLSVPGAMMRFDLADGFPAVTTKKLAFKSVIGELCAFLRASRNAAEFRALGCKDRKSTRLNSSH